MEFKSLACFPVSRLTPIASYMTIMESTKDTANSKDPAPYLSRAAVVRPQTVAEWELGIPPDPTRRSALKFLFKAKSIRVFKNWATTHPVTALIRS